MSRVYCAPAHSEASSITCSHCCPSSLSGVHRRGHCVRSHRKALACPGRHHEHCCTSSVSGVRLSASLQMHVHLHHYGRAATTPCKPARSRFRSPRAHCSRTSMFRVSAHCQRGNKHGLGENGQCRQTHTSVPAAHKRQCSVQTCMHSRHTFRGLKLSGSSPGFAHKGRQICITAVNAGALR